MRYLKLSSTFSSSVHQSVEMFHGLIVASRIALPWIDIVISFWDWGQSSLMDLPCGLDHASFQSPGERPEPVSIFRPVVLDALATDDPSNVT